MRVRLDSMRELADNIDGLSVTELADALQSAVGYLEDHVLPHSIAEEGVLYPAVSLAMGAPQATATMSRDHLEIARLAAQLRYLTRRSARQGSRRLRRDIRRVLYGIDAITSLHMDKEEEIYFPILDAFLTDEAARDMMGAFEDAASRPAVVSA